MIEAVGEGVAGLGGRARVGVLRRPGSASGARPPSTRSCRPSRRCRCRRRVVRARRALGIPALTAYHCLFADGPIDGPARARRRRRGRGRPRGDRARAWAGARVVATVSSAEKAELARAAGARRGRQLPRRRRRGADPHVARRRRPDRRGRARPEPRARPRGRRAARGDRHLRRRPGDGRGAGPRADDRRTSTCASCCVYTIPRAGAARRRRRRVARRSRPAR